MVLCSLPIGTLPGLLSRQVGRVVLQGQGLDGQRVEKKHRTW